MHFTSRADALAARSLGRLIGIVRGAVGLVPACAPANVCAAARRMGDCSADHRASGEGRHRIPPAIMAPIAGTVMAIAAMAMPVARTIMWPVMRTMMRAVTAAIVPVVMPILNFGQAGGLIARLLDGRLDQRLDRRGDGRVERRNGKQGTQGGHCYGCQKSFHSSSPPVELQH